MISSSSGVAIRNNNNPYIQTYMNIQVYKREHEFIKVNTRVYECTWVSDHNCKCTQLHCNCKCNNNNCECTHGLNMSVHRRVYGCKWAYNSEHNWTRVSMNEHKWMWVYMGVQWWNQCTTNKYYIGTQNNLATAHS